MEIAGRRRNYRVHWPSYLAPGTSHPLVVVLHGGYGTGEGAARQGRWDAAADNFGFIAVFPDGIRRSWNVGGCCGGAMEQGIDDVAFLDALIGSFIEGSGSGSRADPSRVFLTGISNGGMMAYHYASSARSKHTVAAIAPVAATNMGVDLPRARVSLLHIHGTADHNIPIDGGPGSKSRAGIEWPSPRLSVERWRAAIGPDAEAELIVAEGGGHSWPGGRRMSLRLDPPSDALDATEVICEFFARH